jgi:hypothetical protein
MTIKDYEVIADAISAAGDRAIAECSLPGEGGGELEALEWVAENLAVALKRDNPRFNRAVFMDRALGYCPDPSLDYTILEANSR